MDAINKTVQTGVVSEDSLTETDENGNSVHSHSTLMLGVHLWTVHYVNPTVCFHIQTLSLQHYGQSSKRLKTEQMLGLLTDPLALQMIPALWILDCRGSLGQIPCAVNTDSIRAFQKTQ